MNKENRRRPGTAELVFYQKIRKIFRRRRAGRRSCPHMISHFAIKKLLGLGATGAVYLARDRFLNRWVALKVLRNSLRTSTESRERFLFEARCVSLLRHPSVVIIHQLGHDAGSDFIVMEYVPGRTLAQILSKERLSLATCLRYALQLAEALSAFHSKGVSHRDIKPSNILVSRTGEIKILDFGLAKLSRRVRPGRAKSRPQLINTPYTRKGTILGTVGYMAPEQVRGGVADQRSDIFAFGAVLYEMLTGRRAFLGRNPIETMHAILRRNPAELPERVPRPLVEIVARCLAKTPRRRYQSAKKLATALRLLADDYR